MKDQTIFSDRVEVFIAGKKMEENEVNYGLRLNYPQEITPQDAYSKAYEFYLLRDNGDRLCLWMTIPPNMDMESIEKSTSLWIDGREEPVKIIAIREEGPFGKFIYSDETKN